MLPSAWYGALAQREGERGFDTAAIRVAFRAREPFWLIKIAAATFGETRGDTFLFTSAPFAVRCE